ncbi:MAG: prepilin-type N-terminal cleavage/methylation domain-containing protein [Puniceicoccales bacterium]|jgi:prepilin-type N-terminal cleavage/methylation domain-containing protein|nr:prepilin-type N-terminal cleavage/methylation domain-containing protein [Puniceicoccales bacterium]
MSRECSQQAGFTLVELIGVVAIAGILLGVIFPAISSAIHSSKRHRSHWQFIEIKSALDDYYLHYGCYPDFLSQYEVPIPLNNYCGALIESLQGGGSSARNPSGISFMEFSTKFIKNQILVDQFGSDKIYIILRQPERLEIPRHCFHGTIRNAIPENGLRESMAIYSIGLQPGAEVISW